MSVTLTTTITEVVLTSVEDPRVVWTIQTGGTGGSSGGPTSAANVSMDLAAFPYTPSTADDVQAFLEWLWEAVPVIAGTQTADHRNTDFLGFGANSGNASTQWPANNGFVVADHLSDGTVSGVIVTGEIDAPNGYSGGLPVNGIECTFVRTDETDGILRMDFAHNGSYLDDPGTTILDMAPGEVLTIRSVGTHWIKVYYSGDAGSGGGVTAHADLTGRSAADSHPQSAITGLTSDLAGKLSTTANLADLSDVEIAIGNLGLVGPNQPSGYARLDGDGTLPDILVPASIARDSEVSSAIATAIADVNTALSGKQASSAQLTLLAALITTPIGRSLLEGTDAAALRAILATISNTDSRLTDARTPTAHTHVSAEVTDLATTAPWRTISDQVLGSSSASVSISGLTGYKAFELHVVGRSTHTGAARDTLLMRFDSDSGTNYQNSAYGANNTSVSVGVHASSQTNSDRSGYTRAYFSAPVSGWLEGYTVHSWTDSTGTVPIAPTHSSFFWKTGTPSSLSLFFTSGNLAAGTRITLLGRS